MILGHGPQRRRLVEDPPHVALLHGPSGVGKWSLAVEVAREITHEADVFEVRRLTTGSARDVISVVSLAPLAGPERIAVVDLDGASPASVHVLLKTLEEPPPRSRLWLSASGSVLPTVQSRCTMLRFGSLPPRTLHMALVESGMGSTPAETLSGLSEGSVERAWALEPVMAAKPRVLGLLKAVAARNWSLLGTILRGVGDESASGWTPEAVQAFRLWLSDVLSGSERFFSRDEVYGLDRAVPRRALVRAAEMCSMQVRPSLAIALATEALLGG